MNNRRNFLKAGVATVPAVFAGGLWGSRNAHAQLCRATGFATALTEPPSPPVTPYTEPLFLPDALKPIKQRRLNPDPDPNRHQRFDEFQPQKYYIQRITEGVWNYHSQLSALTPAQAGAKAGRGSLAWLYNGTSPGETLVARYGEPVFVRRYNMLPTADRIEMPIGYPAISTHLHNAHTASESDGYPMDFAMPGQFWDHHYAMYLARNDPNEALGSLWYHDHMIDFTSTNVYAGLSGMAIFYDDIDSGDEKDRRAGALRLPGNLRFGGRAKKPKGYDISLILHDVRFNAQGNPAYNVFNTDGHLGDLITVNRKVSPYLNVKRRKYRFRIYDGGPSRFYELKLSNNDPFFIIANDGNLLEEPVEARSVIIGPGNRQDVIIDFSRYRRGQTVEMVNVMEQINGQGPTGRTLEGPERMPVLQFRIDGDDDDDSRIPDFLRALPSINLDEVVAEREWVFDHDMGLWTVNGTFMDPDVVSAAPKQGTAEIWTFRNAGSSWAHPVHIHFEEFQVIEWNGKKPTGVLRSRKDVATLGPNDTAKVFCRFDDFVGKYVIHCHNNVHEDNAMMARWDITAG